MTTSAVKILVVDDEPPIRKLLRMGLGAQGYAIVEAGNAKFALEALKVERPDLILLDLNLPRKDGREVLGEIKGDDDLRRIPVVVLTTSKAEEDILRSYDLHANAYVTKPVDFERFIAVVKQIDEFFVSVVKLPPRG